MKCALKISRVAATVLSMFVSLAWLAPGQALAQSPQSRFADVNGVKLHYLVAGNGDPVVLLHGFAEPAICGGR